MNTENFDDNNEDEILIEGICTLESQPNDYDGTYLTHNEMQEMIKKVVGIPFLRDHNEKDKIGTIKSAKIDKNNRMHICASVNRDNFTSINAIKEMKNGLLNGLSIGSKCTIYENQNTGEFKALDKKIPEISAVKDPDLDHARINFISKDRENFTKNKNNLLNILNYNKNLKNNNKNLFNNLDLTNNTRFNLSDNIKERMSSENEKTEKDSSINKEEEEEFKLPGPPKTQEEEKPQETKKPDLEIPKDPKKLAEYLEHLISQNIEKDKLLRQYETNPGEMKRLKEQQEAKDLKWAKKMEEKVPELVEWLVANAKRIGEDPNNINVQLVIDTLKNATKGNIDAIKPIYQVLAHARAATMKSQSEQEALYQALKSESQREIKSVKQTASSNDEKWRIFMDSQENNELKRKNLKRVQENAPPSNHRQLTNYPDKSEHSNDEANKKSRFADQQPLDLGTGKSVSDYHIPEKYGNVSSPLSDHLGYGLYSTPTQGNEIDQRRNAMLEMMRSNMWDSSTPGHQDMQKSGFRFVKNAPRGQGYDPDTDELTSNDVYVKFD